MKDDLARPMALTLRQALVFWLKLGFISFGGPAGQISIMHQELVERRRWISENGFDVCMDIVPREPLVR